jgi:UDP-GlcNAc:undecaprenyl-phosphate/decaprenyl-phosphate GlcNAc-1-phosphate transferase
VLTPSTAAYATVFAVAFGVTLVLTPVAGWLARRLGALAQPDERRVHKVPTPYFGGLAMLFGFGAALLVASRMDAFGAVFSAPRACIGVGLGAAIACAVGTIDDVRPVSPPAKMSGLVLAGCALYLLGASMVILPLPFGDSDVLLGPDMAPLVTVIWVLVMANATNFIDGLDGLAAGIVAIAAGAFFLYGYRVAGVDVIRPDNPSPLLAVIVVGICIGFLPFNFHPARIFMGDGGALMLGVLMAGSTMLVGGQSPNQFSGRVFFFYLPLIPIVIMGVPILDTLWAILRRARKGTSPAHADKDHLHHRLMRLGHGQRRSVLILWAWTGLLSAFVLFPVYTRKGDAFVPIGIAALGLILYTYLHPGARRTRDVEG